MKNKVQMEHKRNLKNTTDSTEGILEQLKKHVWKNKSKKAGEQEEEETQSQKSPVFSKKRDKIYVTMLGTSGTGKTSYLSGVNQTLIREPDTRIRLKVKGEENQRDIANIAMVHGTEIRDFPSGTNETKAYELVLCNGNQECCEFEFWDYRGALVNESELGMGEGAEVEAFREHLVKSDVILVFVDGVRASVYSDADERAMECQAGIIKHIFSSVLGDSEKKYDVVMVVTKIDDVYVSQSDKENDYEKLCDKVMEIFKVIRDSSNSFAIIPVSAVGEGRTTTKEIVIEGRKSWKASLKNRNKVLKPENVDLVILYACRRILQKRIERWNRESEEQFEECQRLEVENAKKFTVDKTAQKKIQELLEERTEKQKLIDDLKENIEDMEWTFRDKFRRFVKYEKNPELAFEGDDVDEL